MIGHAQMVSPFSCPEGQSAITGSSSRAAWKGEVLPRGELGRQNSGAVPGTAKEALRNELHLHVFLFKIFPGAPQTTDERLYKYKFTRLHNLHVKWGQFSQEVHKPALKQF